MPKREKDNSETLKKYVELVEKVKNDKDKKKSELAFEEIIKMMHSRIQNFVYKFSIPGYDDHDIYQECLIALKYKAIKDYDPNRSENNDISPFDNFASICIRRHLSTKHKSAFQNKSKAMSTSVSIDEDRSGDSEDNLFLSDILSDKKYENMVMYKMKEKEKNIYLFKKMYSKLSVFEKKVFILYKENLSYEKMSIFIMEDFSDDQVESIVKTKLNKEIKKILKSRYKKDKLKKLEYNKYIENGNSIEDLVDKVYSNMSNAEIKDIIYYKTIKSIDNALSRIKEKSKEIYEQYKEQD